MLLVAQLGAVLGLEVSRFCCQYDQLLIANHKMRIEEHSLVMTAVL